MRTLAIDCGGSGIKGATLDNSGQLLSERYRVAVPYPMTPERFLGVLDEVAAHSGEFDRATVGVPGMVRHGVIITNPHYITVAGPHSQVDAGLAVAWSRLPLQTILGERWGVPVRVLNDAQVHGAGVITGVGLEVMFTLGTGLGCAVYDDGHVVPKLELSRAPVRKGVIYDEWIGAAARRRIGNRKWTARVLTMIEDLRPVFVWDRLFLGGGETRKLRVLAEDAVDAAGGQERPALPPDVTVVANIAGISGGVRVWQLPA